MNERRFAEIPEEGMTPEQRRVADAIVSGPRGRLSGPFNALLRSPGLAEPAQRLGAYIRFGSSIPSPLNELAILIVARKWTAQYEWYAHRELAIAAGVNPTIIEQIAQGRRPSDLDQEEAVVFDFILELLDTGAISDATFAATVRAFGEQGVVDLIGVAGYYTMVAFLLNVERYPIPDEGDLPLKTHTLTWSS
jgi:4-carboxymuconolactone decarboxylase